MIKKRKEMNLLQKLARKIIKKSFDFSVSFIEKNHDMKPYKKIILDLRKCKKDTLGKEIANCLDAYGLNLVPKFESHDLKHVLLEYKMTPEGEIRMQAFMIGNGNYSIPSFTIFIFGAFLLPDLWKTFYKDFKKGRKTKSISNWTIEEYAHRNLKELKKELIKSRLNNKLSSTIYITKIVKMGAFISILSGIFGMIFCLPFLFSSDIADLVGAGFPFIGGAILFVGGLLILSNLSQPNKRILSITQTN